MASEKGEAPSHIVHSRGRFLARGECDIHKLEVISQLLKRNMVSEEADYPCKADNNCNGNCRKYQFRYKALAFFNKHDS